MRISINGSTSLLNSDIEVVIDHAAKAAADGLSGWWLAQAGLIDALTVMAVAAPVAPGIELGTAVVPTFPIHPTALAAKALTTQAVCGGRLALGIGVSHAPTVQEIWGQSFDKPIRHVLDYLAGLQGLLEEGRSDYSGEAFTTRFEGPRPTDDPPSVLLAAMGTQMLRIAGKRTDGTLLWMTGPKTIASHISPTIRQAAEEAGRPDPRIVCSLPIAVTDDEKGMREFVDIVLAKYGELPSYRAMLDREGVAGPGEAMVCGNEESVREQLAEITNAGATEFSAAEIGGSSEDYARTRALLIDVNDHS